MDQQPSGQFFRPQTFFIFFSRAFPTAKNDPVYATNIAYAARSRSKQGSRLGKLDNFAQRRLLQTRELKLPH